MSITHELFGTTADGRPVVLYTLRNRHGLEARIATYGGTLVGLLVPDREGTMGDIVLGFDTLLPYLGAHPYIGSLIGRYANRIARGAFRIGNTSYQLTCNHDPHHLHGGLRGFDKQLWQAFPMPSAVAPALALSYYSCAGEEGYPGNLRVTVIYTFNDSDELRLDFSATSDAATVINLTNHPYFNLGPGEDILSHELELAAAHFLPIDETLLPNGEQRSVSGTAMDFRSASAIGAMLGADDEQLRRANGGYDHTWVLDKGARLGLAARVYDPASGRVLEVLTSQPGVQLYTSNALDGSIIGKGGRAYRKHAALCLEPQHFPDSPNHPTFPSTLLRPGEVYSQTIIYRFTVRSGHSP